MPRANWRCVLAVVAGLGVAADRPEPGGSRPPLAKTAETGGSRPPLAKTREPEVVYTPHAKPVDADHPAVKDLTPPEFADLIPADEHPHHHETPGHLAPSAPDGPGFYAAVEALVLRPRREALDFVIRNPSPGLVVAGPVQSLNYEPRGGVRAELGYRLGHSGWEAFTGYTYFRSGADGAVAAGPGQTLFPTLTRPGLTDAALVARADASLEYHVYDLGLGRRLRVDDHFAARAFGGLRFVSVRQDLTAVYDGLDARRAAVAVGSDFDGFGPVVGAEGVAAGWRGFHLYARAAGGLLTGSARNPMAETNDAGRTPYRSTSYDLRKVVPVAAVGVGGGWQYRTVSVRAGYEVTHYFGLTDQPRAADDLGRGAVAGRPAGLSLEGLFVQVGLQF